MVYLGWYYLLLNTPDLAVDNSLSSITIFWICNALFFILVFTLIYSPLFRYHQTQKNINKTQIQYFIGCSVFSVFFWLGIFYWNTFIFYSATLARGFNNLLVFSAAILGSVGVLQLWFSTCAFQLILWTQHRQKRN